MQPNESENLKNNGGGRLIDVEPYVTTFGDQVQKARWGNELSPELKSRARQTLLASARRLCLVAFLIAASTWPTATQTPQIKSQQVAGASSGQVLQLSPEAAQVAKAYC